MLDIATSYFYKEQLYEFKCVMLLNQLFQFLLKNLPNHLVSEIERISTKAKGKRMQSIVEYIDEHYSEKLLLTDITTKLELDLYYLSHFFKECFGLSFQNYLLKIRCEHARQLLLLSDLPLLDISIASGFSDPKYFNKGFQQQYGCTPKEYRKNFRNEKLEDQQKFMLSTQEFLSETSSIITLEKLALK
jgi:YesN/AraC family two-component response regulator